MPPVLALLNISLPQTLPIPKPAACIPMCRSAHTVSRVPSAPHPPVCQTSLLNPLDSQEPSPHLTIRPRKSVATPQITIWETYRIMLPPYLVQPALEVQWQQQPTSTSSRPRQQLWTQGVSMEEEGWVEESLRAQDIHGCPSQSVLSTALYKAFPGEFQVPMDVPGGGGDRHTPGSKHWS